MDYLVTRLPLAVLAGRCSRDIDADALRSPSEGWPWYRYRRWYQRWHFERYLAVVRFQALVAQPNPMRRLVWYCVVLLSNRIT